jgi:hypothetical protein
MGRVLSLCALFAMLLVGRTGEALDDPGLNRNTLVGPRPCSRPPERP